MTLGMSVGDKPINTIVGSVKNPSTEHTGMVSGRAGCLVVGRGAGVAAAETAKQHVPINAVDLGTVQDEMRKQNKHP